MFGVFICSPELSSMSTQKNKEIAKETEQEEANKEQEKTTMLLWDVLHRQENEDEEGDKIVKEIYTTQIFPNDYNLRNKGAHS